VARSSCSSKLPHPDRTGTGVLARVEAWNGTLVHAARLDLSSDVTRRRFVKAVARHCGETDQGCLEGALMKLSSQLPDYVRRDPAPTAATAPVALEELCQQAAPLLDSDDPLWEIDQAIRDLGYGGQIRPALIVELAVTSRLLAMRPGAMPVHLLLLGPPSAGKSYTLGTVLRLHPPEAYHVIDAGSPRVLLYDAAPLRHRALIFAEADSLPAGEDNPAASAVRGLLQEHHLVYKVAVFKQETGAYEVQEVAKDGPTVLITTAVRPLGEQLNSRLFPLEVPYDREQLQYALQTQACLELRGAPEPDAAVVAFHAYLQAQAPWDVVVPYADALARLIGASAAAPRINRDFSRLLSLVKAAALLRHRHRQRNPQGRLVAALDDYATVYDLVAEMYEAAVTGTSRAVRDTVEGVRFLNDRGTGRVTVSEVARHLGVSTMAISRSARTATKHGWLVHREARKGYPRTSTWVSLCLPSRACPPPLS